MGKARPSADGLGPRLARNTLDALAPGRPAQPASNKLASSLENLLAIGGPNQCPPHGLRNEYNDDSLWWALVLHLLRGWPGLRLDLRLCRLHLGNRDLCLGSLRLPAGGVGTSSPWRPCGLSS